MKHKRFGQTNAIFQALEVWVPMAKWNIEETTRKLTQNEAGKTNNNAATVEIIREEKEVVTPTIVDNRKDSKFPTYKKFWSCKKLKNRRFNLFWQ